MIEVNIDQQTLIYADAQGRRLIWPCSTSARGCGFAEGSLQTPTGRFRIAEMIGHEAPAWTIFQSRCRTDRLATAHAPGDLILTRILWLDGLDPENANTRSRFIYIHGTNHEETIGTPCSHGCIRMRNQDIIELFDRCVVGEPVLIHPPTRCPTDTPVRLGT